MVVVACSATPEPNGFETSSTGTGQGAGSGTEGGNNVGGSGGLGGSFGIGGGTPMAACKVTENNEDALPPCTDKAPANSFAPEVQWSWTAPPANPNAFISGSFATPLVGNFTDDNNDGAIDLCDVPDILVTAIVTFGATK